mmetsp:Transcript_29524/g.68083  ORF Transcript_29524/g.68083 Transcript_29524/m.68083 type:complete len:623 (+) Transcript_29524:109-1977(+)
MRSWTGIQALVPLLMIVRCCADACETSPGQCAARGVSMLQTARSVPQAMEHTQDPSSEAAGLLESSLQAKRHLARHGKRNCRRSEGGACQLSPHGLRDSVQRMSFHSTSHGERLHTQHGVASSPKIGTACLATETGCSSYAVETGNLSHEPIEGVELVITRYSEDLTWLDALPDFNTTVYNKGTLKDLLPAARDNLRILDVENAGREDETMLRHIHDNYDNLAEITVFLQGWPYDHCAEIGATLRASVAQAKASTAPSWAAIPLAYTYWQFSPKDGKVGLANQLITVHGIDEEERQAHNITEDWLLFDAVCSEVLQAPCPDTLWVAEGAQWLAGRDAIRTTPRDLYAHAVQMGEGYQDEYRGIILESVWPVLFGLKEWDPRDSVHGLVEEVSASPLVINLLRPGDESLHCWSELYEITGDMRLWSCNSVKAFCELAWYSSKVLPSMQYLQSMRTAPINESDPRQQDWRLTATLQTALPGEPGMVQIADGEVTATISTSVVGESEWTFLPAEHSGHVFIQIGHVFIQNSAGYLGCASEASNISGKPEIVATLQSEPLPWRLVTTTRGRVSFESPNGRFLCATAARFDDAGKIGLVCSSTPACTPPDVHEESNSQSQAHFMVKA